MRTVKHVGFSNRLAHSVENVINAIQFLKQVARDPGSQLFIFTLLKSSVGFLRIKQSIKYFIHL